MSKKTELKVNMHCQKCKTEILKAITNLSGVDQVTVDGEKGMVTVIGDVDPACLAEKVRKTGKHAEIVSVGPPKKPDSPLKNPNPCPALPPCVLGNPLPPCACQHLVPVSYYDNGSCTIL